MDIYIATIWGGGGAAVDEAMEGTNNPSFQCLNATLLWIKDEQRGLRWCGGMFQISYQHALFPHITLFIIRCMLHYSLTIRRSINRCWHSGRRSFFSWASLAKFNWGRYSSPLANRKVLFLCRPNLQSKNSVPDHLFLFCFFTLAGTLSFSNHKPLCYDTRDGFSALMTVLQVRTLG